MKLTEIETVLDHRSGYCDSSGNTGAEGTAAFLGSGLQLETVKGLGDFLLFMIKHIVAMVTPIAATSTTAIETIHVSLNQEDI